MNLSNETLCIEFCGEKIEISIKIRRASGNLLLLLHGIGCSKESFDDAFCIEELRDFSICAFDFPGHGKSGRLPSPLYSLQSYADVADLVIRQLSYDRIFIAGHSMGGAVAVIVAQRRSDIECLVSADGNLVGQDCGLISRKMAAQSSKRFLSKGFSQFLSVLQNSSREDFEAWAHWCADADPHALHQVAGSLVEWSDSGKLLELFNSFTCKAYLYGSRDDKHYLLQQIKDATVYAVPEAGHFMMVENPDSFYQLLAGIIDPTSTRHMEHVPAGL